jgi:hypothetical protein
MCEISGLKRATLLQGFRGKCCDHAEQDEQALASSASRGSDKRGLVARAGSRRRGGAHFRSVPPAPLANEAVSHRGWAPPVAIWSRRRQSEAIVVLAGCATRVPDAGHARYPADSHVPLR